MRIICLFTLKDGATAADYEAWARGTDIPAVNALPSVRAFSVHRATGLFGLEARPPYDYVEVIDVHGMEPFVADVSDPAFQRVAQGLKAFTDDQIFILTEDV